MAASLFFGAGAHADDQVRIEHVVNETIHPLMEENDVRVWLWP